jgi:hypothetical protein
MDHHFAFAADMRGKNAYVTSEALGAPETATTVRHRNGRIVTTDGPFAETKEVFGGFYMIDCRDLDEAIAYGGRIPEAIPGVTVEIRPVVTVPGWKYLVAADRR